MNTVIRARVTQVEKTAIEAAAERAGMNVSEFIRTRVLTHRASFAVGNNGFITETREGLLYSTERECIITSPLFESAIEKHRANGYHADCVICQSKYTDPRTLVSETPDDDGSDCPSADPQPDPRSEAEQAADDDAADQERTQNDARPY